MSESSRASLGCSVALRLTVAPRPGRPFAKSISCPSAPSAPIRLTARDGLNRTKYANCFRSMTASRALAQSSKNRNCMNPFPFVSIPSPGCTKRSTTAPDRSTM